MTSFNIGLGIVGGSIAERGDPAAPPGFIFVTRLRSGIVQRAASSSRGDAYAIHRSAQ